MGGNFIVHRLIDRNGSVVHNVDQVNPCIHTGPLLLLRLLMWERNNVTTRPFSCVRQQAARESGDGERGTATSFVYQ